MVCIEILLILVVLKQNKIMNISITRNANQSGLLSVLSQRKSSILTTKAAASTKIVYYVEDCTGNGEMIDVDYTLNDEWLSTSVKSSDLRLFVLTNGLNDYCFDSCANGVHLQDAGSYEPDTFIAENLNAVIKAYLQAKKIGQNVN